jgi:hypothetical protein
MIPEKLAANVAAAVDDAVARRLADAARRRADRQAERVARTARRNAGLRRRHAAKLARVFDRSNTKRSA